MKTRTTVSKRRFDVNETKLNVRKNQEKHAQMTNDILPESIELRLINESKHRHDITVLRLGNELRYRSYYIQRTLSVSDSHSAVHPIHRVEHASVIETES